MMKIYAVYVRVSFSSHNKTPALSVGVFSLSHRTPRRSNDGGGYLPSAACGIKRVPQALPRITALCVPQVATQFGENSFGSLFLESFPRKTCRTVEYAPYFRSWPKNGLVGACPGKEGAARRTDCRR